MKTYLYTSFGFLVCCGLAVLLCISTTTHAKYDPSIDSPLEQNIDDFVKQFRRRGSLASTERTSFVVYDLSRGKKLVSINEDTPRMAASLIKNFVMLVYFHEVKQKRLTHNNTNKYHLRQMIRFSSNRSTNHFIRLVGGPSRAQRILKANYPYFEQTLIVETIPLNGRTYRNKTSAQDLNKFYVQL
ncbi:serine hydrolase, partial [Candidatus Poribacteria bacterium]|nr:serine hydrolase [Candidatus Poribacteria bacterium]